MSSVVLDTIAAGFLLVGLLFLLVAAFGIVRLPDVYLRLHAATKGPTLGIIGMLLAVALHLPSGAVLAKVLATIAFSFVAMPIGSHLLAKAALRSGPRYWQGTLSDEHAEDGVR